MSDVILMSMRPVNYCRDKEPIVYSVNLQL